MDSDQPENSNPAATTVEDSTSAAGSSMSQRHFFIRRDSRFTIADLVNIEPGTLLLAGDDNIGKEWVPRVHAGPDIGFQFFPVDFIRQQHCYSMSRAVRPPEELLIWAASYDSTIRTNWQTYQEIKLEFHLMQKSKDESIGLFLGDVIIGTRGAVDVVVLLKILSEDDIGWICFLRNKLDELLELQ